MPDDVRELIFDQNEGTLQIGPLRYVLMRPDTVAEIQKGVEDRLGPKSAEYLYAAGASWSVAVYKRLKSALPEGIEGLIKAVCVHATELGWGRWGLERFSEEEKKLVVRVFGSPFANAYGKADGPVCHLISGAVSGLAESIFKMPTGCTEQVCMAQGGADCIFVATGHDVAGKEAWAW
jgi:predicted hydrocarbon binding protein